MSTLKVNKIENTGTTDGGIEIDNTGHVQIDGVQLPSAGPLSNRNLIINGAMQVAQRGTEETGVTTTGYYTCDRFQLVITNLGTWTVQRSTDAPDGFSNSFRMLCTTADASPAANDQLRIRSMLEGFDCQRLFDTGTTTHPMRLSFWVKSNRTGDASVELLQFDNTNKMFTASYNIAAADTWEHKVIEIPVDTAAAFANDNGTGLQIAWWLNSGADFTGGTHSAGWVAFDNTARNATNLGVGSAVNDDFFITGIQLEVGSVATPFEHRSYGDELQRCQRYCLQLVGQQGGFRVLQGNWASNLIWETLFTSPTTMRTIPTSFEQGPGAGLNDNWVVTVNGDTNNANNNITAWNATAGERDGKTLRLTITHSGGGTTSASGQLRAKVNNAFIRFDAEL